MEFMPTILTFCIILFFTEATVTLNSAFGAIPGVEFALDDVRCNGNETSLTQCFYAGPGLHNCDSTEIAGVICKGNISKREYTYM